MRLDGDAHTDQRSPPIDGPYLDNASPDDVDVFVADLATQITSLDAHPSNVEGHFCDLFTGMHKTEGMVALKRPRLSRRDQGSDIVRRFLREARTWLHLDHPNILRFLGAFRTDGFIYLVSPYMRKGTIVDEIHNHPLKIDRIRLIHEIASALEYLHTQGIIHGDLKGNNILISNEEHALLCDFGLSRMVNTKSSTAQKGVGNARWQAPEIWNNDPKSFKTDVYAFAMTIVEIISGDVPFKQYADNNAVIVAVMARDERPVNEPTASPEGISYEMVWRIAAMCWHKDPDKRLPISGVTSLLHPPPVSTQYQVPDTGGEGECETMHFALGRPAGQQTAVNQGIVLYEKTEDAKDAAASKAKHGASASQGQPAPRKVRFNVGECGVGLGCNPQILVDIRGTQYQLLDVVNESVYGIVCSALHRPTGRRVAIRKITPLEHPRFCLRTLRELKLLKFLSVCVSENMGVDPTILDAAIGLQIISILDIIKPPSIEQFKEVYLIQELMETDMHRVIRTQDLSDDHAQYFVYQTLRVLKALHSADVIHRDLRPSNLLLNANCDLKVCDFGLARSVRTAEPSGTETGFMTEYVETRWYRAPEIMLTFKQYTKAIDIWSVGCILAEMLSGKPLFPGRDYHHQLTLILDVLGTPTLDEFYAITTRRSRDYIRALPFRKKRPFSQLFPNANPLAVDFLTETLTFDPKKRITVEDALCHPYLEAYHDPDDEPVAPPLDPDFFEFDLRKDDISLEQVKELLYEEIMTFKPTI